MPYDIGILQQDLKAAKNALEKDDLENLNILANRIMSNCHIFNEEKYFLFGFLLKDMATTLLPLKYSKVPKAASTAKALTAGVFKKIFDAAFSMRNMPKIVFNDGKPRTPEDFLLRRP